MSNLWHLCSSRSASIGPPSQYNSYVAVASGNQIVLFGKEGSSLTELEPVTLEGTVLSVHISPDGEYMAAMTRGNLFVYKRIADRYLLLATQDVYLGYDAAWSPDGQYLISRGGSISGQNVYKRTGDTFTGMAIEGMIGSYVSYSPLGNYIALCNSTAPYLSIWKQSGDTFTSLGTNFLTTSVTRGSPYGWTADEKYLAVSPNVSGANGLRVFERTGDEFNILPALPGVTTSNYCPAWSPDGSILAVGKRSPTSTIELYHRSGNTFTKLTSPPAIPNGGFYNLCWSNDNLLFASTHMSQSPGVDVYKLYVYELIDDTLELLTSYDLPGAVPGSTSSTRGISVYPWSTT